MLYIEAFEMQQKLQRKHLHCCGMCGILMLIKREAKVLVMTNIEILKKLVSKRQEFACDSKGMALDERAAAGNAILIGTVWLNIVHDVIKSKAAVKSDCATAVFAVKTKESSVMLADRIYNALQDAGIACSCRGCTIESDLSLLASVYVSCGLVRSNCMLTEYSAAMEFLADHK